MANGYYGQADRELGAFIAEEAAQSHARHNLSADASGVEESAFGPIPRAKLVKHEGDTYRKLYKDFLGEMSNMESSARMLARGLKGEKDLLADWEKIERILKKARRDIEDSFR